MVQAIIHEDQLQIGQRLHNDLERVVIPAYPQILQLKETFQNAGCLGAMMSGSGSTVFALCDSEKQAQKVHQQGRMLAQPSDLDLFIARLTSTGIQVMSSNKD